MPRQPLSSLFCQYYHCPPATYQERAFRRCLYLHARLLAPVIRILNPGYFAKDLELIRYLGQATSLREANVEVLTFQDDNRAKENFWRTDLRIRVSGRKVNNLAHRLFSKAHRG